MATEPCPQCGTQWQAGQDVCPNCGFRRAAEGAQFRTGMTGVRPIPQMGQQPEQPPPPPAVPPPGAQPPVTYQPPAYTAAPPPRVGGPPPVTYGANVVPSPWSGQAEKPKSALRPIALIGAIAAGVSSVLPWLDVGQTFNAFDLPAKVLINGEGNFGGGGFSVGILLVILGVLALALTFAPQAAAIRRFVGILIIAVPVLFVIQAVTHDVSFGDLFGDLSFGFYVALVGGILVTVG
jgi:hypothetical protein